MSRLSGGCLCGAVTYSCDAEPILVGLCHCTSCQKGSGSAFSTNVVLPRGSVEVDGELAIFEDVSDDGRPVLRSFCGNCGSPIISRSAGLPDLEFIKAGTLDDTSWIKPTAEIWCESAQAWVEVDESRQLADRNPPLAA